MYFPYYNLLAVAWNYPSSKTMKQLFDGSFFFQNSSDQDYNNRDYKVFPAKLRHDIQITSEHEKNIKEYFDLSDEDWNKDPAYYERCYRYKLLVQKLGLNKWFKTSDLDDHDYHTININLFDGPNYSPEHRHAVKNFIKNL